MIHKYEHCHLHHLNHQCATKIYLFSYTNSSSGSGSSIWTFQSINLFYKCITIKTYPSGQIGKLFFYYQECPTKWNAYNTRTQIRYTCDGHFHWKANAKKKAQVREGEKKKEKWAYSILFDISVIKIRAAVHLVHTWLLAICVPSRHDKKYEWIWWVGDVRYTAGTRTIGISK